MSVCPICKHRVTNGADKQKDNGVRTHKGCVISLNGWREKQKRERKDERERKAFIREGHSIYIQKKKFSPFQLLYGIFKERIGL